MSTVPWHRAAGAELTVDLGAIASNARVFAARTGARLMAVVKADGFGHDGSAVARTALDNGASWLGVATVEEALALRRGGLTEPALSWLNPVSADYDGAVVARVDLAVPSAEHLTAIAAAAVRVRRCAYVHLHVDVGMARDGAESAAWPALCDLARTMERRGLVRVAGIMGHLGWADDPTDAANDLARRAFLDAVEVARQHGLRPRLRHLAATAATLTNDRMHLDLCRIGAGLVGIDPSGTTRLRPAMSLRAPVVGVREVGRGASVGYGHTYVTRRRTRLALLAVGYADGLPRAASGRAQVQLRGRIRPVVGLVSMDQVIVDVGADPVRPGEVATIFGPGDEGEPTVADWAGWSGTIEHEIVTGIGQRVARRLVDAGPAPYAPTGAQPGRAPAARSPARPVLVAAGRAPGLR